MYDLYAAFLNEQLDEALAEASPDAHRLSSVATSDGNAAKAARRRVAEAAHALLKVASRAADAGVPCSSLQSGPAEHRGHAMLSCAANSYHSMWR